MSSSEPTRWSIATGQNAIVWNVSDTQNPANRLPHADHLEMSGERVSLIVRYRLNAWHQLFVERDIFWPQLRVRENDVRGYLHRVLEDRLLLPRFLINDKEWLSAKTPIVRVAFDGVLTFDYEPHAEKVAISRVLFPAKDKSAIVELWRLTNQSTESVSVTVWNCGFIQQDFGVRGNLRVRATILFGEEASTAGYQTFDVAPASTLEIPLVIQGEEGVAESNKGMHLDEDQAKGEADKRLAFSQQIQSSPEHIVFTCPDPELNQLFAFCKLRAAESLFATELMGLVHSPGGRHFYCGIWANDQCEYAGPFFAFLNDTRALEASVNAYRYYAKHMKPDYTPVPTSFEMGGNIPYHAGGDRGDAAMIASGLSRFLLTTGDRALATELYPVLQWCNEYNRRKTNSEGVVLSDTDELEGRFSTGEANLSTSTLAYDGYRHSASVARELGNRDEATDWDARADALAIAIEAYFGAIVEGFETYQYHIGNDILRSWICLPLVFNLAIGSRKRGTLDALFSSRLWTPDGLATQAGETTFWDRSTLYGLRGAFIAGETEPAYERLLAYSRRRLLGDHVPYPVEAYPENAQAHLSAESALYCRVFLEGLLGIVPTGFSSFTLTPRLPKAWEQYECRFTAFGGRTVSIHIQRKDSLLQVTVKVPDAKGMYTYRASESEERTHRIQF